MKKTVFRPQVSTLLSIAAGQEVEAVIIEGKVFIEYPMPSLEGLIDAGKLAKAAPAPKETVAEEEDAPKSKGTKKVAEAKRADYTEAELIDLSVAELLDIIEEMGIDVPKEGKNTNKKLRLLILEAQGEEEEEEPTKPSGKKSTSKAEVEEEEEEEDDNIEEELTELFTKFDEEELEEEDVVKALVKLGYDKKDAKEIVDDFLEDDDISVKDYVAHLLDEEEEEEEPIEEEEEEAPKKGRGSKEKTAPAKETAKKSTGKAAKKDYEVVELSELSKGDKVSVYFKSDDVYVEGEVKSILRGKVTVLFDDDSTEVLNAKENTEIRLYN